MHLKSLTVRGFKSFASATTFAFEPGVTAVVGPNGSGKSNVVDALAWVMGEQGAKSLRGGSMEDVIFAGTARRQPLGRASVSLTIDNSDGALPIDYTEVTISRTMFRSGGSEYTINGAKVRLLDIQELLSDSGLGREMHVIVGQGQLDQILHATPEQRRGFIEEAAGVLKHRRRRERAVRKLDSMKGNLERLEDLISEITRQLAPLGRQARTARRAQRIQYDLRDALSRIIADDLVQADAELQRLQHSEETDADTLETMRAELNSADEELSRLQVSAEEYRRREDALIGGRHRLAQVQERLRSVASLATERASSLTARAQAPEQSGRDPEQLRSQAKQLSEQAALLHAETDTAQQQLQRSSAERAQAEEALKAEELRVTEAMRAVADRRAGLATLQGQVETAKQRSDAALHRRVRAAEQLEAERAALQLAQDELGQLQQTYGDSDPELMKLQQAAEAAQTKQKTHRAEYERIDAEHRNAEISLREASAQRAALESARSLQDAGAALEQERADLLQGRLADVLSVTPGWETAAAACLGSLDGALVASDEHASAQALQWLKEQDAGRAHLVYPQPVEEGGVGSDQAEAGQEETVQVENSGAPVVVLPEGAHWATQMISSTEQYRTPLYRVLDGVVFVQNQELGEQLLSEGTAIAAVTAAGDVLRRGEKIGGSAAENTVVTLTLRMGQLQAEIEDARSTVEKSRSQREHALAQLREAEAATRSAQEELAGHKASAKAHQQQLERLEKDVARAEQRVQRCETEIDDAETAATHAAEQAHQVQHRLEAAQTEETVEEPSTDERDRLGAVATAARAQEVDARLALRAAEEQHQQVQERAASLRRNAQAEEHRREQARQAAQRSLESAQQARAVAEEAQAAVEDIEEQLQRADHAAAQAGRARGELQEQVAAGQKQRAADSQRVQEVTQRLHQAQLKQTELRLAYEGAQRRADEELSLTAEYVIEHFGPQMLVPDPDVPEESELADEGVPYVRSEQQARLASARRELKALGKVNPLALEEHAALEERHKYLQDQLTDLKSSRQDLLDIIHQVDATVERVFTEAWEDTRVQFERVFARLFPGGEGRLELTDPDDMLATGVEVQARPPGKRIKRLSLLSGGERSLTAVALLVAIFKARPSPFYVMDEVEAALDDTNLSRLLVIFEELRESSQLIVITHQKRTMEIADALYGVSMRQDGSTRVVSQRLSQDSADPA